MKFMRMQVYIHSLLLWTVLSANIVKRLIEEAFNEGVIVEENYLLGVTGRAGITGRKPELKSELMENISEETLFVSDALAMGAAMMARCMNSLGTPKNPVGGCQGGQLY